MHCCRIINVCIVLARAFLFLLLLSPFLSLSPLLFNRSLNLLIHCELDKYCLHLKWNDVFPSSIIYLSILHFQTSNSLRLKNISHRKEKKKIEDWTLKGNRFFGWLLFFLHFTYSRSISINTQGLKCSKWRMHFFRCVWSDSALKLQLDIRYTVYILHLKSIWNEFGWMEKVFHWITLAKNVGDFILFQLNCVYVVVFVLFCIFGGCQIQIREC